ncbi:transposase [Paraliobacillus sp. JSM ZJ581]|uniref:transposase n=1 Tax=Paraliobacillus sp. JSM ZJ581 TaxID=3342118 RepID=UPI0035A8E45B
MEAKKHTHSSLFCYPKVVDQKEKGEEKRAKQFYYRNAADRFHFIRQVYWALDEGRREVQRTLDKKARIRMK